jgi:hypothetical protein
LTGTGSKLLTFKLLTFISSKIFRQAAPLNFCIAILVRIPSRCESQCQKFIVLAGCAKPTLMTRGRSQRPYHSAAVRKRRSVPNRVTR